MITSSFIFMHRIQHIHREIMGQFFARLLEFQLFLRPQSSTNQWQVIPIAMENNPSYLTTKWQVTGIKWQDGRPLLPPNPDT
jgi:hypothetical protein